MYLRASKVLRPTYATSAPSAIVPSSSSHFFSVTHY